MVVPLSVFVEEALMMDESGFAGWGAYRSGLPQTCHRRMWEHHYERPMRHDSRAN